MSTHFPSPSNNPDRMPNFAFRAMVWVMDIEDFIWRRIDARAATFGIQPGMTVVDYGCGPGRYTTRLARLVGEGGRVYAVDVHELALQETRKRAARLKLRNVIPVLARGYDSTLPAGSVDMICCLDMFFAVRDPSALLAELRRIARPSGRLVIDDGHQPRSATLAKIRASGLWKILNETRDHLVCQPVKNDTGMG